MITFDFTAMNERATYISIGTLASRAKVSVRTLHHYDDIGLLRPAIGGAGQQRLYGLKEITRLHRIRSLQSLGLSLEQVRESLSAPDSSPLKILESRIESVTAEIESAQGLHKRLTHLTTLLRVEKEPAMEDLLIAISAMEAFETHFTPDQIEYLEHRREEVGDAQMHEARQDWDDLFEEFRDALARGDDPSSPAVQELSKRAKTLIEAFSGGNAEIEKSVTNLYAQESSIREYAGAEPELWEYMARAAQGTEQ